jgi:Nucleotidyl transferase AbiEii toxin, Type IV TA system
MPLLREHRDDLRALVGITADARGIREVFVEKDLWVTEVLRAATASINVVARDQIAHPVRTIFKGGTSLSRIFGLIDRFSEDVDLLIGFPDVDASIGAKDKALKAIRDAVTEHLGIDAADAVPEGHPTKGVKRDTRYRYPELGYELGEPIRRGVLLEMGCRGGLFPTQTVPLRSMLAEHAIDVLGEPVETWDEFAAFDVEVLAPERTLLEKLALLHNAAARSSDNDGREYFVLRGRHIYDVHQLLTDRRVIVALTEAGPGGVAALCGDIDNHSKDAGFSFTPRPPGGYGDSPLLDTAAPFRSVLEHVYNDAMELVYGQRPTLDECLETIRANAGLI